MNKEHEMGGQKLWSGKGKEHITGRSTQQSKGFVLSGKTYFRVGTSILRTSFCLKLDRSGVNFTYRWSFEHGFEPDPWYDADCLRTKCSKCSAWKLPVVADFPRQWAPVCQIPSWLQHEAMACSTPENQARVVHVFSPPPLSPPAMITGGMFKFTQARGQASSADASSLDLHNYHEQSHW